MRTIERLVVIMVVAVVANVCLTTNVLAQRQYRFSDMEMRNLIRGIETHTDSFSRALQNALDRSRVSGTARENETRQLLRDFEYATDQLRTRFESRQSTAADARLVLERAGLINDFLLNNRLDLRFDQSWRLLQADLDQLARAYYINWSLNTTPSETGSGYRLSDAEMRQLVRRLQFRANQYSSTFMSALNRSNVNGTSEESEANRHLSEFQAGISRLRDGFNRGASNAADARNVLEHAAYINRFLLDHQLDFRAENDWASLKSDLERLASAYSIAWNWTNVPGGPAPAEAQLTGTYRLNSSQGDNPRTAAENATSHLPAAQRQRVFDALLRRLDPPNMLAIDQHGIDVAIASSRAPQVNLVADGREHQETSPNGRISRVRASLVGDRLTIERMGERAQDFSVTFDPVDNGRRLVVTRRLYTEQLNQPVSVQSYYDRVADVAQLDLYNTNPESATDGTVSGNFIVPNGTQLDAVLNTNLSTRTARDNDRFSMTVRSPQEYEGATIEGYVTNVSRGGRISGRSEMAFNFDTIRLRDGRSYKFAGLLENVRTPNNETVRIDNEGAVREGDSQTNKTIQRTAIGTAVGAIIGAIAGGGKGAAIGAVLGAGAGAGSVYVQGRDDLELPSGSDVTIRATAPTPR